jgi:hypothetical protein
MTFIQPLESRTLMSAAVPAGLTGAQRQDIAKLASNLAAIHALSDVTPAELAALATDLNAVAAVAVKPSSATVNQFKADLSVDLKTKPMTDAEKAQLTVDFDDVLTSADVPTALAEQVAADVGAIFASTHITNADVKEIAGDLSAIAKTFKAHHAG